MSRSLLVVMGLLHPADMVTVVASAIASANHPCTIGSCSGERSQSIVIQEVGIAIGLILEVCRWGWWWWGWRQVRAKRRRNTHCLCLLLNTPPAMSFVPSLALALLAAVLGLAATATLCKLPGLGLPLAATRVGTLTNTLPCVVLAASISHDDTCPILDLQGVHRPVGELFHDSKDIGAGFGVER